MKSKNPAIHGEMYKYPSYFFRRPPPPSREHFLCIYTRQEGPCI